MGRYIGPSCRLCRREGVKLCLKGERCKGSKCTLERRDRPPGMHNWRRGKLSEYGIRFREKQKVKRYYGVFDTQFKNYFKKASRLTGNSGEILLILLESRLDNVIYRGGLASSHAQARQFINHGHILVNGKKIDIPSYSVQEGDVITPSNKEKAQKLMKAIYDANSAQPPSWLEKVTGKPELKVIHLPVRSEIPIQIQEQLLVEFCSR